MHSRHHFALAILAACTPAAAFAQSFTWGPSIQYDDDGSAPAIASVPEIDYETGEVPLVEIHQGASGNTLLYHVAQIYPQNFTISFGPAYEFDTNANAPAVAVNADQQVVEVHEGGSNIGTLWYRVGTINGLEISWSAPQQYDTGYNPSISISGSIIVEVHNATNTRGPMMYKIGTISGSSITWSADTEYDSLGWKPSVAITNCESWIACFGLEVHNGLQGAGPLWYHSFTVNSATSATWQNSVQYDTGYNPRVQILESIGFEVHDGTGSPGPLWYHTLLLSDGTWNFSAAAEYDSSGWNPAITYMTSGAPTEVHTVSDTAGALYYRVAD
jgi:hypothetical protein